MITDQLADLLLTPSADADENLRREGVAAGRIHRVGSIMIDTLMTHLPARCGTGTPLNGSRMCTPRFFECEQRVADIDRGDHAGAGLILRDVLPSAGRRRDASRRTCSSTN